MGKKKGSLVFINRLGKNYMGENTYEFIFTTSDDIYGEDWDAVPALGAPQPPELSYISSVAQVKRSDVDLELIQNSYIFGMIHSIHGIIALGWEKEVPTVGERLVFSFGEAQEDVINKLYSRDIVLEFQEEINHGTY